MLSTRVDYDAIAEHYDSSPHRAKTPDPELTAFLRRHEPPESLFLLDIACGTGNQLIANRSVAPRARLVGIDGSLGMLRQARRKAVDAAWAHGDCAALPFVTGSFDFVSCQYALHHFRDQAGMLREALRVLRGGGRLALYNLSPHDMPDFIYYPYFPESETVTSPISGRQGGSPRKCAPPGSWPSPRNEDTSASITSWQIFWTRCAAGKAIPSS